MSPHSKGKTLYSRSLTHKHTQIKNKHPDAQWYQYFVIPVIQILKDTQLTKPSTSEAIFKAAES